ncbi:MAG: FoF1 ATP synthase subunit gamma, partial [Bacillota bacterium]|nr:FoF1 ATP synthase subunit gamma [Bacillota bacterium]
GVVVVYSKFVSTISFTPRHLALLPLSREGISADESYNEVVYFEPGKDEVLAAIMPKYVAGLIYGAMIESSASEQAARRLAMEAATGNAEEIIEELTLTYNQARQAAITQEISEIVGGAEALS